jgi:type I restriction enzyme S subunit
VKKGWQTKKLGEALEKTETVNPVKSPADEIDYIDVSSVSNADLRITATQRIKGKDAPSRARKRVRVNDVIFATIRPTLRRIAIVPEELDGQVCSTGFCVLRAKPQVDGRFVFYFLQGEVFMAAMDNLQGGASYPAVSDGDVREQLIPLPPLPEQRRIVALLDEAFEGIATAKANAEQNLQNARALFESHLNSVFSQKGKGLVDTKLEAVCGFQNGFAFKSNTFKPSGVPIIRISNIQDGRIDTDNRLVFFDPNDYRENLDRYRIVEDDLVIAMSGATTGKLGFNTENTVFYLNQRVGKFEPGKKLNKRFLYHFLSTKVEENLRISAGTAQPNLSTEQIKGFVLPLPPIDEQTRIVEALEALSEETRRLAAIYEQKLAALEELKKSLLNRAFNGEL